MRLSLSFAPDRIKPVESHLGRWPARILFGSSAKRTSPTDRNGLKPHVGWDGQWGSSGSTPLASASSFPAVKATDGAGMLKWRLHVSYAIARPEHLVDLSIRPSTSSSVFTGHEHHATTSPSASTLARVGRRTAYAQPDQWARRRERSRWAGDSSVRVRHFCRITDNGGRRRLHIPERHAASVSPCSIVATRLRPQHIRVEPHRSRSSRALMSGATDVVGTDIRIG